VTKRCTWQTGYDYIVVRSRSADAIVASSFSENGKYQILGPEAGKGGAGYIWSRPPAGTDFMTENPRVNWRFFRSSIRATNRPLYFPRGKMFGGFSSMMA
jgi:choline dehydrogenase